MGINLTDSTFRGEYHGNKHHEDDTEQVIQRAGDLGCVKFMVTGSDLEESKMAVDLAARFPGRCYATVGVHPCRATSFDEYPGGSTVLLQELKTLAIEAKGRGLATAFGEIGLDYDRLHFAGKEQQLKYFEAQLDLAVQVQLPLFLHSRAAGDDFERLLSARLPNLPKRGLVHSFTGTREEMERLVALGLDIGVNGCSMKTEENLDVVKAIPLERLQIETDGPWVCHFSEGFSSFFLRTDYSKCEMRASHASAKYKDDAPELPKSVKKEKWTSETMVKGRNESATIVHVAHVIAKVKEVSVAEVCHAAWKNSIKMFGLDTTQEEQTH